MSEENHIEEIFEDAEQTNFNIAGNGQISLPVNAQISAEPRLPSFNPAAFLGKITYELSSNNFIT